LNLKPTLSKARWGLRKLHHLARLMNQGRRVPVASVSLINEIRRLGLGAPWRDLPDIFVRTPPARIASFAGGGRESGARL
jgi:hypothetical protein